MVQLMHHLSHPSGKSLKQLSSVYRSSTDIYTVRNGLLQYSAVAGDTPRVVVPDHGDLRLRIMYEYHDAPVGGHRGREKTYLTVSRDFYWPRQYHSVRKYIGACEVCQRAKSSPSLRAQLQPLPVPEECWDSVLIDLVFGFPADPHKNTGILVFVERFSKMVHLVGVLESISALACARVFIDTVFRLHGLPHELVSDRDPRFPSEFWRFMLKTLETRLKMSASDHPETDGQTERPNRVLVEILRGYVHSFTNWSEFLLMVEFAINNSVRASTTRTPFFVNGLRHPRIPTFLECDSRLRGEGLILATVNPALTRHVLTMRSPRSTPMSITSSGEEDESKSEYALTGHDTDQISITPSASKDTLAKVTSELGTVHFKRLYLETVTQQMNSNWFAKRLSISYKTLALWR